MQRLLPASGRGTGRDYTSAVYRPGEPRRRELPARRPAGGRPTHARDGPHDDTWRGMAPEAPACERTLQGGGPPPDRPVQRAATLAVAAVSRARRARDVAGSGRLAALLALR